METLIAVWRFLLLAGILIFPQLFGILLYFRLKRAPRLAAIVAALAPSIVFFWLAPIFFAAGLREPYARGGCGMPAMAAAFFLLAGTVMQLFVGVFAQLVLAARRRRKFVAY